MANLAQIEKYLKTLQLPYRLVSLSSNKVVDLNEEAYTVDDVVKSGIDPDDVVKTLIIRTNDDFIALALLGNDRVDFKKVRAKFGGKSELAKPDEVLKVVGVPVGAVCPILVGVPIYIDRQVINLDNVHMGSGDLMHGLEMKLKDLILTVGRYQLEDFAIHA